MVGFTSGGNEDVFAQLVQAKRCDNVWALCMHHGSHSNGTLTVGGVDARLSDGPIAYVPDSALKGFHSVETLTLALALTLILTLTLTRLPLS